MHARKHLGVNKCRNLPELLRTQRSRLGSIRYDTHATFVREGISPDETLLAGTTWRLVGRYLTAALSAPYAQKKTTRSNVIHASVDGSV